MARCTAACAAREPEARVGQRTRGSRSAVRVARAPSSDVPRAVPPARPAGPDHPDAPDDVLPDARPRAGAAAGATACRSWVAHAVDSACSTSSPSRSDTGVQWSAMSEPTSCGQRPSTVASVSRGDHPRSSDTRETSRPNGCGSRSSGPGPDHRRRLPFARRATPDRSAAPLGGAGGRRLAGGTQRLTGEIRPSGAGVRPIGRAGQGLRLRRSGHALGQRSTHAVPRPGDNCPRIRPRRAVGEGRRTVVSAAHHQSGRSYPQYPQPCPQPWVIMLEALTWCSAAERPRDARSGRRSPQTGPRRGRPARRRRPRR